MLWEKKPTARARDFSPHGVVVDVYNTVYVCERREIVYYLAENGVYVWERYTYTRAGAV